MCVFFAQKKRRIKYQSRNILLVKRNEKFARVSLRYSDFGDFTIIEEEKPREYNFVFGMVWKAQRKNMTRSCS